MRMFSVSSPLSTTQALKGDSTMPAFFCTGKNFSRTMASGGAQAPAITRPWPSRNLVPECMTMSAPSVTGRCSAGVAKQLSTHSSAPALCAMSASAAMSQTSVSGLVGVSANSSLVLGRTAARQASTSVCDTLVDSTPKRANSEPISFMVEPNIDCEQITWSPARSRPMHISRTADMPEAVAMAASVPSIAARRCSKLVTVGLPVRP
jgi:hypothetical protein